MPCPYIGHCAKFALAAKYEMETPEQCYKDSPIDWDTCDAYDRLKELEW